MPLVSMKVEGLKELEAAIKELPKATGRNVIRRALTEAAQPIVNAARANAPAQPGSGVLKRSILVTKVRFTKGDVGKQAFAEALKQGKTRQEAREALIEANTEQGGDEVTSGIAIIGVDYKTAFYAHFVEFGTSHSSPKPFMRPAWDAGKMKALEIIQESLKVEIDKAVARIAKKQARAIAQAQATT
jgi:HK97 gp10 family phage protein